LVGVVGEAVEGALSEDGIVEERDPFLDGTVGGHDGGRSTVALDDDLVEVTGLLSGETPEAEVVDNEEVGCEEGPEGSLRGVIGTGLMDELEHVVAAQEANGAPGPAGGMAEGAREEGFADADGAEEGDIVTFFEEGESEEVADPVPVEGDGSVPIEVLEGGGFVEPGALESVGEVFVVTALDFVVEDEFEEVEGREGGFLAIGDTVRKGRHEAGELEALEAGLEGWLDGHASPPVEDG
jgi:hypothetical protein